MTPRQGNEMFSAVEHQVMLLAVAQKVYREIDKELATNGPERAREYIHQRLTTLETQQAELLTAY